MDKFLIKTKRNDQNNSKIGTGPRIRSRQSTLQSLAGVVVIEDIEEAKQKLESPNETVGKKIEILKKLKNKKPAKEVLLQTGIGKTVRKLGKAPCGEDQSEKLLQTLSYEVYRLWRKELERKVELTRNKIEVKSDKETETRRSSAESLILSALQRGKTSQESLGVISQELEREVLGRSNNLVGTNYKRTVRRLVFGLRGDQGLTQDLVSGDLTVRTVVRRFSEQV